MRGMTALGMEDFSDADGIKASELEEKFCQCAARVLPKEQAKRAFDLALDLDNAKSIHGLMELVGAKA